MTTTTTCLNFYVSDKFASKNAQMGIICLMMSDIDLPFARHDIIPDIIIKPQCLPTRMNNACKYCSQIDCTGHHGIIIFDHPTTNPKIYTPCNITKRRFIKSKHDNNPKLQISKHEKRFHSRYKKICIYTYFL